MTIPSTEDCRRELERLGWHVELVEQEGAIKMTAVQGGHSWLYYGPDLETVADAALAMARRNSPEPPAESAPNSAQN
jgi:hypothetical protein